MKPSEKQQDPRIDRQEDAKVRGAEPSTGAQAGQTSRNEGEGSRTAARAYNDATERFAKSGRVEESGERAKRALDSGERSDLERAEKIGKSRMREEDPAIREKSTRR